jgi:AcrR family transcriptional regulator
MPKLWSDTIADHRRSVRDATLDAAALLVAEHGLRSVTMSAIAGQAGIGRATLYKYFPDVESILHAWHERQVAGHLEQLSKVRGSLASVLRAYAEIVHEAKGHDSELVALLHGADRMAGAHHRLLGLIRGALAEAAASGEIRTDVPPDELAGYCVHALQGAGHLSSRAGVRRLVGMTLDGLRRGATAVAAPPDRRVT